MLLTVDQGLKGRSYVWPCVIYLEAEEIPLQPCNTIMTRLVIILYLKKKCEPRRRRNLTFDVKFSRNYTVSSKLSCTGPILGAFDIKSVFVRLPFNGILLVI